MTDYTSSSPTSAASSAATMTSRERGELLKVVRRRAAVAKRATEARAAALRADFEQQLARIYSFDEDAVWRDATTAARAVVAEAQQTIARRCKNLGIPEQFAPSVDFHWHRRGENAVAERRTELRFVATTRIGALQREAVAEIEARSVELQERLVTDGLTTDAARHFLQQMPGVEQLMPPLRIDDFADAVPHRTRRLGAAQ